MGSTTTSGSPVETRGATGEIGELIHSLFNMPRDARTGAPDFAQVISAVASPLQRLGSEGSMNVLGFDPRSVGLPAAVRRGLTDPRDATAGLFGALAPIENRARAEGTAGLLGMSGASGARFGRSALESGGSFLADFEAQRLANREQSLLGAQGLQNQLIGHLIPGFNQASSTAMGATSDILGQLLGFAAPGAPVIQQSPWGQIAGGILGTGLGALTGGLGTGLAGQVFPGILGGGGR